MILTHPDQMAKAMEFERSGVMFPGGPYQMLAYIYAVEGVPAYASSVHARMIDMANSGDIEPFDPNGVNMSGLTTVEKRGECAGLREQTERILGRDELCYVRARFGLATIKNTIEGLTCFAEVAREELAGNRRRAQRGIQYVADLVQLAMRPNHNPTGCTVMSVSRKHQMGQSLVSKDISTIRKVLNPIERRVLTKVDKKFADGHVLPC